MRKSFLWLLPLIISMQATAGKFSYQNSTEFSTRDFLNRENRRSLDRAFNDYKITELGASLGVGSDCGNIKFDASLKAALNNVLDTKYFGDLGKNILASSPMLLACYFSPTWCGILKHSRINAQFIAKMRQNQCEMIDKFVDTRVDEFYESRQRCVREEIASHGNSEEALRKCGNRNHWDFDLRDWTGQTSSTSSENKLLGDSAKWAGFTNSRQSRIVDLVKSMVGDFIISRGSLRVDYGPRAVQVPPRTYLMELRRKKRALLCEQVLSKIRQSPKPGDVYSTITDDDINEINQGLSPRLVSRQTLRHLSLLPRRKQALYCNRLSSTMAQTQFTHEMSQSLDFLQIAATNPNLPEKRRAQIREKRESLKEAIDTTVAANDVANKPLNKVTSEITEEGLYHQHRLSQRASQSQEASENFSESRKQFFDCSDRHFCQN